MGGGVSFGGGGLLGGVSTGSGGTKTWPLTDLEGDSTIK